ncbi:hypothetical protein N7488_009857 [Penicillium malachiteum]|nr:hypothetical protein N7488_009857 [Penicillium malachiteum]
MSLPQTGPLGYFREYHFGDNRFPSSVSCYNVFPMDRSTKNAIVIFTDSHGLQKYGVRHIANQFAQKGYFVVIPDLFYGDPAPEFPDEDFDDEKWFWAHAPLRTDRIIEGIIRIMRDTLGCQRIGGAGYSFGGEYVCRHLQKGMLDVGFIAHPSELDDFKLEAIEGPLSLALGARDKTFTTEQRHEVEEALESVRWPYQITLYSHVGHGFAIRGDPWYSVQRFGMEQSFNQALVWFDEYLKRL